MLIEHLQKLYEAGVASFKIEGRMKTAYYVATVVHAYRQAIDGLLQDHPFDHEWKDELEKAGTRDFTTGFLFGNPGNEAQDVYNDKKQSIYAFVAKVLGYDAEKKLLNIEQRNRFFKGDTLEILSPDCSGTFTVAHIYNDEGQEQDQAPHPQQILNIPCEYALKRGDMLRKKLENA
jgi:putative protease